MRRGAPLCSRRFTAVDKLLAERRRNAICIPVGLYVTFVGSQEAGRWAMAGRVFVVGVGMTEFEKPGRRDNWGYPDMAREAGTRALQDSLARR